jgi:SNF2 family DNA or RNA helicase
LTAELTAEDERVYNDRLAVLRQEYRRRLANGEIKPGADQLVVLSQLRRAGENAKVGPAIQWAEEVRENGGQCIIFTNYRETAEAIASRFNVPALTGETSLSARDRIVADFQSGKQTVFVGTVAAGGVGLTLHANGNCRDVLLLSRPWTPGDATQAEDRAHRIGQTGTVSAVWMQHGDVDTQVDARVIEKASNAEEVLAGKRDALTFANADAMAGEVLAALGW